jgi:tetratricopeptide (TPR) repeat protein
MSTLQPPKQISKRQELRQDTAVTFYVRAWEFFDENRTLVYGALAGLVAVVLAIVGWAYYQHQQGQEAEQVLAQAITLYEAGDFRQALDGTEATPGLLSVVDGYGGTQAGNLARFYVADAYFRLGEYDQALQFFETFDKGENIVGASAYAGMAAIYEQRENYEEAGDYYLRAAEQFESNQAAPDYLMDAGNAYEEAGAYDEALEVYQTIQEDYPESSAASNIDFFIARVQAEQRSA